MDEGSGLTINDKSGNGNDGTISGATWTQGKYGSALSFDGADEYVDAGNDESLNVTGNMTIEGWVKPNAITSPAGMWMGVAGKKDGHNLSGYGLVMASYSPCRRWCFVADGLSICPEACEQIGRWDHLAGVYDGSKIILYQNGVLMGTRPKTGVLEISSDVFKIGHLDNNYDKFNGLIDDVRVYNYARTEEEIRLDYNAGMATHLGPSGKTCSEDPASCMDYGLVGNWDMDEGNGLVINDNSGNNNHGTLANGPKWTQGKSGGALQFDGKDDYVDLNSISAARSQEGWFYFDQSASEKGANMYLFNNLAQAAINNRIYVGGNSDYFLATIPINKWIHVVFTYDNPSDDSTAKLYINGVRYSINQQGVNHVVPAISKIGAYTFSNPLGFKGSIDGVRVYNRALSEAEVRYHYNHGGPVAHWDMDEGSGSKINDKSGNGNDGTLVNGPTWTQGKYGSALSFDGVDDYASIPNNSDLDITADENFSYGLWLKTTSTGCSACHFLIKYNPDGYSLHFTGDYVKALVNDSDEQILSPGYRINDGNWHYVEVVFDRSTDYMTLYVDGAARSQTNVETIGSLSNSQALSLMRFGAFHINGQIDDLKFYNYARTEEEIRLDYNAGMATHLGPSGKTCDEDPASCMDYGLVGNWDMDEGGGSVINDNSGNNNHGTLTNGPKWTQGKEGTALDFDGKNDYVAVADSDSLSFGDGSVDSGISIETWVRYDTIGAGHALKIAEKSGEYVLTNNSWLRLYLFDNSTGGILAKDAIYLANTYKKGEWIHVVVTYDGSATFGGIKFYLNGKFYNGGTPAGSSGTYVSMENTANPLSIAGPGTDAAIDGVKIYNRALSEAEVRYHYNHGGPVAHWEMDEGEGTRAFDSSGNNNHGAISGATWTEGKYGSALSFDGADDYVNCGTSSSLDIANSMTASAWIYPKTLGEGSAGHIVGRGGTGGWIFYVYTSNSLKLYSAGGGIQATSEANSITLNQWQYVTFTYDKQNVRFFVNGVEKGVTAETDSILNTGSCIIGARSIAGDFDFNGYLDDVRVYNYARTAEQIRMDYQQGVATHLK
jgi:hypothetical protein